ncbi:zinc-binding dehydrogenase [Janthinobacterium lividum]|nr:zinc-binding dehydrogenase [Janthinobacterium lividum]
MPRRCAALLKPPASITAQNTCIASSLSMHFLLFDFDYPRYRNSVWSHAPFFFAPASPRLGHQPQENPMQALALGAKVYATGSAASRDAIEALGAHFIDYRSSTVDDYVAEHTGGAGFDIVYDTVGGATLDASFKAARMYGGHVVSCLGWGTFALSPLTARAATYSGVFTLLPLLSGQGHARHGAILREANKLIEAGKLKVRLDPRRFTLRTAHDAHAAQMDGSARGKLVVEVED